MSLHYLSQERREKTLAESIPAKHRPKSLDQHDDVVELQFGDESVQEALCEAYDNRGRVMEEPILEKNSGSAHFSRMSEEGREPLAAVMSFMVSNCTYRALSVICQGNNWRKIAFALGMVFHTSETIPLRVQIARGHDRLRDLVTTCMTDLRRQNRWAPLNTDRLIQRLFTSHGYSAP